MTAFIRSGGCFLSVIRQDPRCWGTLAANVTHLLYPALGRDLVVQRSIHGPSL